MNDVATRLRKLGVPGFFVQCHVRRGAGMEYIKPKAIGRADRGVRKLRIAERLQKKPAPSRDELT